MANQFNRTELLFGIDNMEKLKKAHVIIFGVGGVGGYVVEALARAGAGEFTLVDNDVVAKSNINRQIIALENTIGLDKVQVMKDRILQINPNAKVHAIKKFFLMENESEFEFQSFDYIIDAVDTVKAKIALAVIADKNNVPIISSMGTGNKVNPMGFVVADINKTEMDPLAKVMRRELKNLGIKRLKVVYSKEKPLKPLDVEDERTPMSNSFVPPAAGLLIASEVIRDLTNNVIREELRR